MAIIQFSNGTKVNFKGNPTPEDVDFVAKQIGITAPTKTPQSTPQPEHKKGSDFLGIPSALNALQSMVTGVDIKNAPKNDLGQVNTETAPKLTGGQRLATGLGGALSLGSLAFGGGEAEKGIEALAGGAIKRSIGKIALRGAGEGAAIGGASGLGQSLEDPHVSFGDAAKNTVIGAGIGGATGGLLAGAGAKLLKPKVIGEIASQERNIIAEETPPPGGTGGVSSITNKKTKSDILSHYEKAVKPGINIKMTPAKLAEQRDKAFDAINTIKENKANLKFTDENGINISGETPKTLQQLTESIEQTKKTIFNQYDSLAKEAGDAGVKVDLIPISNELDSVIKNKALSITSPKSIKYAELLKDRLLKSGTLDASTAQEVIQNYNKSLEAFYRNPNYDNASQAAIDAMIANNMRKALDEGISGLTGKQYQALKNQYGSLKAIEKDATKASMRDARKNTKGLIDFTDIFSGGQIVNGILSLNPATIAQGAASKGIATLYKYLNNPNRYVEKMFASAEKIPYRFNQSTNPGKSLLQAQPKPSIKMTPKTNPISKSLPRPKPKSKFPVKPVNLKTIDSELQKTFQRLKMLPKNIILKDGTVLVPTPYKISANTKKIIGSQNNEISFTKKSLKHLAEKGALGEKLFKQVPEVLKSPDVIRQGETADRYLLTKTIKNIDGKPMTVSLEVTENGGDIVVTSFKGKSTYLDDFEILWRSATQ